MKRTIFKYLTRFLLPAESAHTLHTALIGFAGSLPFGKWGLRMSLAPRKINLEREVFGIHFPNPVGLAGGLDKNGEFYNDMANFGFGFVEIGSLTPQPQDGNPKPRCFRVPGDRAIINRFGINNKGVKNAVEHLKKVRPEVIVAANISKNTTSVNEDAAKDYESSFALLYDFVDMFVVNISCPNVVGLTALQDMNFLSDIIDRLLSLRMYYDEYRPILLKVSPDLSHEQLDEIIDYSLRSGIDGIVAGNTTRSRDGLTSISPEKIEAIGNGGMSGAPVHKKNLELVKYVHTRSEGKLPIIGVGGIMSPEDAQEMIDAGASLVELYSGFIYEGPGLIKRILKHFEGLVKQNQVK